jgi:hypothetical protein
VCSVFFTRESNLCKILGQKTGSLVELKLLDVEDSEDVEHSMQDSMYLFEIRLPQLYSIHNTCCLS